MDITPLIAEGTNIIQGYGDGGFKVNGESLKGNLIILPSKVYSWDISDISMIDMKSLEVLTTQEVAIDILLVGCGNRMVLLPFELRQALKQNGIVADAMDTGAACRTYNVLLAEGRNVAAAVMAV